MNRNGAFNERILEGFRPNFFELLSQEAMHSALRPAFQYFIKVFLFVGMDTLYLLTIVASDLCAEQAGSAGSSMEVF
jgi:hypothetical protein